MTLPFPLRGNILVTGPSNVGKTRLTASALEAWIISRGPTGVVVFEFGPDYETGDRVLGGLLTQFITVPSDIWYGILEAYAPRAETSTEQAANRLAHDNARRASKLFDKAPANPIAVFVNDATIPFQHPDGDIHRLLEYCERADVVVMNAFDSDELGSDDPVSVEEAKALSTLKQWADHIHELTDDQ